MITSKNTLNRITFGNGLNLGAADLDLQNVLQLLNNEGWLFLPKETYFSGDTSAECASLDNAYSVLPQDPYGAARSRSYLKLRFNLASMELTIPENQSYSQTYQANSMDGGKVRHFARTSEDLLNTPAFQKLVLQNLGTMLALYEFDKAEITIGLHSVRYTTKQGQASYSSPAWLHKDDEPIVFLNVLNESANLVGGDSIIAYEKNIINRAIHLAPLEGILLTKRCFHAVTPMETPRGASTLGYRDILLTTVEARDDAVYLKRPENKSKNYPKVAEIWL